MKVMALVFFAFFTLGVSPWLTDFEAAKKDAKENHKLILLNFSGSDWCGPCIRLHQEIFESSEFRSYADGKLALVNADFPRLKKNQLSREQTKQNESLADTYNPNGIFPYTVLLDANGKVLKTWEGFPKQGIMAFTQTINEYINGGQ